MKMLEQTFRHLAGFGELREKELLKRNISNWDDFEKNYVQQLTFNFGNLDSLIKESKEKLLEKDSTYFTRRLPNNLHFVIPHSFPEETIFLDIETTGLSRFYDSITVVGWSFLNSYNVFVNGFENNKDKLINDLSKAKTIITFNGSMFDIPFLKKTFPGAITPECHIDLRFFSRRVGYRGGQKRIEKLLGFKRPKGVIDIDGYEATLLWHKYKEGDIESLKRLIQYNAYDIDGMKFLFEKLTKELIAKQYISIKKDKIFPFSKYKSNVEFSESVPDSNVYIQNYTGKVGPSIYINELKTLDKVKVVGIDLTGSEKKATGWSVLENGYAITKRILTNDEIVEETIRYNPTLISIDSPLSIPIGRTSVYDDDPQRDKFGITRECERIMAKRGIKSYPCLIQSMQKLTERGIYLADRFRKLGYAVIESYPGAAQDIIGIPRKGKSLEYLIRGLKNFGIKGHFDQPEVSHDEIDAITSAIVGYFYLANQYEALGNDYEDYLIIPDISLRKKNNIVIGLSGLIGSGKTTAGKIIEKNGFGYGRYSMVLKNSLELEQKPVNRTTLQEYGDYVNKEKGQRWLGNELLKLLPKEENLVIDGLRFLEDYSFLREKFGNGFYHIHITTDTIIRKERYLSNKSNNKPFEDANQHDVENEIDKLKKFADVVIINDRTIEDFKFQLNQILEEVCQYL